MDVFVNGRARAQQHCGSVYIHEGKSTVVFCFLDLPPWTRTYDNYI